MLIAQDWRASVRASFSYIKSLLDVTPILRGAVTRVTADTLDLNSGVRIATYPCRPPSVRGLCARVLCVGELAFFRSTEGYATDGEMLRAVRPAVATTGRKIIIISSPYGQSGTLFDLHRKHFGRESSTLVWQASAPTMNTTLSADYLARMESEDPQAFKNEVLGEFRPGLSVLFDPETIERCVREEPLELSPVEGIAYRAFVDSSGGKQDAYTVAIAHRRGKQTVIDVVRGYPAPFNPQTVTREIAALLRSYRVAKVTGDRFGGDFPAAAFATYNIKYEVSQRDRSALYLGLLPIINSQEIELPNHPTLLRELRTLERRVAPSGKDRIDHLRGSHDDTANCVAGVASLTHTKEGTSALEGTDPILSRISTEYAHMLRPFLYGGSPDLRTGDHRAADQVQRHLLEAATLRRRFEIGLIDRETYEEKRKHELPFGGYGEVWNYTRRG